MNIPIEPTSISHGIQLAIAPVFLLTAVASMIGAVVNRLARIIDRARIVEARVRQSTDAQEMDRDRRELHDLRLRGLLANASIGLLTLCGFMIGGTIVLLFLGETIELPLMRLSIASFLGGLTCFMFALACFFAETWMATRVLNFGKTLPKTKPIPPSAPPQG